MVYQDFDYDRAEKYAISTARFAATNPLTWGEMRRQKKEDRKQKDAADWKALERLGLKRPLQFALAGGFIFAFISILLA